MRMKFVLGLIYLFVGLFSGIAFAGEHGEASIKELAWPVFNFSILFGLIIWKARKPISVLFTEKSKKVQELFRFAENKYNEAKKRHDEIVEKLKNVDAETERIMLEAHAEAEHLEIRTNEEIRERTERMWTDSHHIIESERRQLETELNNEIIETVVRQTKDKISTKFIGVSKIGVK
jgi:F0F1-type ATP synthase membrane subunit b/b'